MTQDEKINALSTSLNSLAQASKLNLTLIGLVCEYLTRNESSKKDFLSFLSDVTTGEQYHAELKKLASEIIANGMGSVSRSFPSSSLGMRCTKLQLRVSASVT